MKGINGNRFFSHLWTLRFLVCRRYSPTPTIWAAGCQLVTYSSAWAVSDVQICIYWNIKRDVSLCFTSYSRSDQGSVLTLALFAIEFSPNKAVIFESEKLIKLMNVELRWYLQNETAREPRDFQWQALFRERITAEGKKTLFVHPSTSMRLDCSLAGGPGYMVEGKWLPHLSVWWITIYCTISANRYTEEVST